MSSILQEICEGLRELGHREDDIHNAIYDAVCSQKINDLYDAVQEALELQEKPSHP